MPVALRLQCNMSKNKGLDFVDKYYDVEHTFPFENTVEDLTAYCKRMGRSYSIN